MDIQESDTFLAISHEGIHSKYSLLFVTYINIVVLIQNQKTYYRKYTRMTWMT